MPTAFGAVQRRMNLVLSSKITGDTLRFTVMAAHLNAAHAPEFKAGVEAARWSGVTQVEIDLGAVEFVDSSGVGALLSVVRKRPPHQLPTRLMHVKPKVVAVLELMCLRPVFDW